MTTIYTPNGRAVHASHRGSAEPVATVLEAVLTAPPHKARLSNGLGLAFTPADANGRCKLMLSRLPKKMVVAGMVTKMVCYPEEKDVEGIEKVLAQLIDPAAFGTLKQSTRAKVNDYGCVALFWYDVRIEGLL